jgi:hypothetical protein
MTTWASLSRNRAHRSVLLTLMLVCARAFNDHFLSCIALTSTG